MLVIHASTLFNGKKASQDKIIVINESGRIGDVSRDRRIDCITSGYVTPAFIDAHSHIGMARAGEPSGECEANDELTHISPLNDPLESIYFDDRSFEEAVDWGVLYSCIVPGSGNLIGGKAKIIKNFVEHKRDALLKDYGYKMALGYNPKGPIVQGWKGERPTSRMGAYGLLRKKFDEVLLKKERAQLKKRKALDKLSEEKPEKLEKKKAVVKDEYRLEFSSEDLALLEILSGEKPVKVHVHKADDIDTLVELKLKYNINVTAEHTADVCEQETYDYLAEHEIPVVYGPMGALAYKVELKNESYKNVKHLIKSNATYGLMTDHPVTLTPSLRDCLKFFMIHGISDEEALSIITYKNAKILGIDNILGTLETGKVASLIVWNKDPLHFGAYPKMVIAEGKIVRQ
jgi:imidazolonepropionase-like amidohydrolase